MNSGTYFISYVQPDNYTNLRNEQVIGNQTSEIHKIIQIWIAYN